MAPSSLAELQWKFRGVLKAACLLAAEELGMFVMIAGACEFAQGGLGVGCWASPQSFLGAGRRGGLSVHGAWEVSFVWVGGW